MKINKNQIELQNDEKKSTKNAKENAKVQILCVSKTEMISLSCQSWNFTLKFVFQAVLWSWKFQISEFSTQIFVLFGIF